MNAACCERPARILVMLVLACLSPASGVAQTPSWMQFRDPQTGLSFHYPPGLHVRQRDPEKFGLPQVQSIVEIIGDTTLNPGTVVLRFLVHRGNTTAAERAKRREYLRRVCTKTSPMLVDGHKAMVCVSAGSAAAHWSVEILEPRECTILTLLGGAEYEQALPPPHNGEFPLLSIIRTVRFAPTSGLSIH